MRHWLPALVLVLLLAATPLLAPGLLVDRAAPARVNVALVEGARVGATLFGAPVVHADEALGFVTILGDEAALRRAAALDARVRYVEADGSYASSGWRADDPILAAQYAPQQVRAPDAWQITTGESARTLCVVDSGIRWTHEEFRDGRYLSGYDFVADDDEPWDEGGHGTHVLGIAAASVNNGRGMAGIANVGYHVARTAANDSHYTSHLASGIRWCADEGADVINLSMTGENSTLLREAVLYAHARGALLVGAAGNQQNNPCEDCVRHPAKWPEVLAITCVAPSAFLPVSTDAELCTFSRIGPEAELAAPGAYILSASHYADDRYYPEQGTSMSAPHVAGIATLVWSYRPELPREVLVDVLRASARDLGPQGHDARYGHGLVDARAALEELWPVSAPICRAVVEDGRLRVWAWSAEGALAGVTLRIGPGDAVALAHEGGGWFGAAAPLPPGALAAAEATCIEADGDARRAMAGRPSIPLPG